MDFKQLLFKIKHRLKRLWLLMLLCAVLFAYALYLLSSSRPTKYTSQSKVFALANTSSTQIGSGLEAILGTGDGESFGSDGSVNIIDLGTSIYISREIAEIKPEGLGGLTVADVFINEYNKNKLPWEKKITRPNNIETLKNVGGALIRANTSMVISKSGILLTTVTSSNPNIVTPVNYYFLDRVSQYYIDLKVTKAKRDYDFAVKKLDSLNQQLRAVDNAAIRLDNTTQFVSEDKVQYSVPKENLVTKKTILMSLQAGAINNVENALWRIQKETPIVKILDAPEPPYNVARPSIILYTALGFFMGFFLALFVAISDLLGKMISGSVSGFLSDEEEASTSATKNVEEIVYQSGNKSSTISTGIHPHQSSST